MPIFKLEFDTGNVPLARIVDAIAANYGYGVPGPSPAALPGETKAQFVRRVYRAKLIEEVRRYEENLAIKTASESVKPIVLS